MNRTRLWAVLSALSLTIMLALSACGSATGLLGGGRGGTTGIGEAGAPGEAGATEEAGNGGRAGSGGSAGNQAGEAGEAGQGGVGPSHATLVSIAVSPSIATAAVGTKVVLKATGVYSDHSTRDVSATATWASDNASLASVQGGVVTAIAPGTANIKATLGGQTASAKVTVPTATVKSLTVTPATGTAAIQGTVAFHAVVSLSDGTTQDVTATATWTSSNTAVASVSSGGIATGLSAGNSTIRAAVGAVSGSGALTVTTATLVSIAVTPTNPTVGIGVTTLFTATGTFSDATVSDVSSSATFASSTPAVASIDATTHSAKTLSAGTTTITATVGMISGTTTLTVSAFDLVSITVTPAMNPLAINGSAKLIATGTYSDTSTVDLSQSVVWQSSSTTVATVSNASGSQGTVTAVGGGSSTITATLGAVSGTATVTVTTGTLVSIAVTPADPTLPIGTTTALTAKGTYSDNSVVDITSTVTWSSDTTSAATISNATGSAGTVTAIAVGTSNVHATLGTVIGTTTVTVTAAKLVSITITPANPSIPAGTSQALIATANYTDSSTVVVTATAVWSSSATNIATVSNASGDQGDVTAIARGTSTVTATYNGVAGSTIVTVSAPTVKQIVISPITDTVHKGNTVRYTATAILSNNTQQTLNQGVTWTSSDTTVATIAAAGGMGPGGGFGGGETATAVADGVTTISATYQGVTGTATLTVSDPTVVSIVLNPVSASLAPNQTQQFSATAIYSDNTQTDVTGQATWVSSDPTVASVSTGGGIGPGGGGPGGGMRGLVTALADGTTTITATLNGLSGTAAVVVTSAIIQSIEITPVDLAVGLNTQTNFTATALYSDNTTQNVTGRATWISTTPAVASVSTANGSRGQATALTAGTTTISATYQGITGSTPFTVNDAKLTSIQITPFSPRLPVGFNINLVATGVYSDNTTRDLTNQVTWTSSAPTVASVSAAGGSRGLLTPVAAGTATITATYQMVSGTDAITVTSAKLTSIAVSPAAPAAISVHGTQAFTALGTLDDTTTFDVTNYVTWLSTTDAVASISNANGSRGVATGLSTGQVTISAVRGTLSGTAPLTVQ